MKTVGSLVLGLALVLTGTMAAQAQNAASQARGDAHGNYEFEAHRVQTHQMHARDYAGIIYQQGQVKTPLPPEETAEYVGSVKQSIAAANKALDKLAAAHAKDEVVKKSVEKIKGFHKSALAHCGTCEDHCKKPVEGSKAAVAACCVDMVKDLDAAQAETAKLMKHLKIEKLTPLKSQAGDAAPKKSE